ncbi:MAG: CsbD family protein [Rhodospirillales bacterium]|nr:CsbD family protein [Rhodospirillales bacterium]
MDWYRIEGSWKEFKGKAQSQWGQLTDDDLTMIGGKRDELFGKLQARYGYSKDRARQEIDRWLDDIGESADSLAARAMGAKNSAMEVADNFGSALHKSVEKNPVATLALTGALAFVLGALWKS